MDLGYPGTALARAGMNFVPVERDFGLAEIADERADMGFAGVGKDSDCAETDWLGTDWPLGEGAEASGSALNPWKNSGHSDSAIQMGC
jgi:hypothetical protein